jgi:hypothetical protein
MPRGRLASHPRVQIVWLLVLPTKLPARTGFVSFGLAATVTLACRRSTGQS